MKKKYKLKKSATIIFILFIILLIALITFIISLFKTKSYSVEYDLNDYKISENYDNKEKLFYYEITYDKVKYDFIFNHKYIKEKKLINDIISHKDEKYTCLEVISNHIETKPLCSYDGELIDAHLVSDKLKEELNINNTYVKDESYKNYKIYNTDNKIFIWSYKGLSYLNNDNYKEIDIFSQDIYSVPLVTKINNYIVIPDYEQKYSFNKVYILDTDNLEIDTWKLKYDIPFDSTVLGINDKSIFIVDNKNKIEYELVPHRKRMRIVASSNKQGVVYNNGIQEKVSMNKLVSSDYKFTYKNNYNFYLKDKTLYMSYLNNDIETKISNQEISSIISINNDNVYYLVKDTLYKYSISNGETKLVTYSEWEYNYQNSIFIND